MRPRTTARLAWSMVGALLLLAGCGGGGRDRFMAAPFDPDSIPEAYRGSTAALMWPGATRAFQIRPDGNLYNGEWLVRFDA